MAGCPRRRRGGTRYGGWVASIALLVAACTGGNPRPPILTTVPVAPLQPVNRGGDITLAAEQQPGCMDWISSCVGSVWGVWTVETNTMPRAYDYTSDNLYKPSILLTGEADLVTGPAQIVTYHINPKAVWSDGQFITSHDFKYTWDQIAHGQNISDQTGYKAIATVDDADPHTAVVTFSQSVADWKALFGGFYGVLPSHLLEGQDRNALMKDGYTWSGGPWALAPGGWIRSTSIKLIPNPNYWGKHPDLNSATFNIIPDPEAALQAYTAGQVMAVHPQAQVANLGYKTLPGTYFNAVAGLDLEGLWFNLERPPLTSKAVRQAIAYSLDRDTIANQLFGEFVPSAAAVQGFLTPAFLRYSTPALARYHPDVTVMSQLMVDDGWTKGADGVWVKAGQPAALTIKYPADSPRHQLMAQLVQAQLTVAGFVVTPVPEAPATLFGQDLPAANFAAGLFAADRRNESGAGSQVGPPPDNDPRLCRLLCSAGIPTAANGLTGTNFARLRDPAVDRYLGDLDTNLTEDARIQDYSRAAASLADLLPEIPIAAIPDVIVVNANKVGVEGGTFNHNLAYGPYASLNQWYLR